MFRLFANAWKVKDIRNKILYTFVILAIIRLGAHVALPGISVRQLSPPRVRQAQEHFTTL